MMVKFVPAKNIKIIVLYCMPGISKAAMLAFLVENPPVAMVVNA